jgi:hypothetical protein
MTTGTRIQLRRDTAATWTSNNPVLALGEPGLETDTDKVKYGDGSTAWASLGYPHQQPIKSVTDDFGAVGDCTVAGVTVSITSGSPTATLSGGEANLKKGQTLVIDGSSVNYTVLSVSGTTVTLTGNASASLGTKHFVYGTDNTAAFNAFFPALVGGWVGFVGAGRYLITGTVGIPEPGSSGEYQGITVICGGAGVDTIRYANQLNNGSSTLVWGGAAGGTMVQFSRVSFIHIVGGLALAGQGSYDPSGVFTTIGQRAGLGFHLSQASTPWTGTGYLTIDELACSDMTQAVQFGTNLSDNNADTSIIHRLVIWRCNNGVKVKHTQGLGYQIGWMQAYSVPGYAIKFEDGGALDIGSMYLTACGTGTTDPTVDTYCLDLNSSVNGYGFKVGLLRIEANTIRVAAVRNTETHLQIGMFVEANIASQDDTLFYVEGGTLQILGGAIKSFYSAGKRTFYLVNDVSARGPRLVVKDTRLPVPGNPNTIINLSDPNVVADFSFMSISDPAGAAYPDFHSRLERGPVWVGGATTDATTATRLDPMNRLQGTSWVYSYGPRVPLGTSIIEMMLIGDRGTSSPSVFKRRYTVYRAAGGTVTLVNTQTVDTDVTSGTDQVFSFGVDAVYFTCNLQVKGTAATTVNWRARFAMTNDYGTQIADY